MKKKERLVFFYDLTVHASSRTFKSAKPISVRKAFELMARVPLDQRIKEVSKGMERFYISDWEWDGDILSVLINKSDKSISDPVFTNPKERKRRTAEKHNEEGQDFSAHVVVKLPDDKLKPAFVLVEQCSGLGVRAIQGLLNQILKESKKLSPDCFEQTHPSGEVDNYGNPKKYMVDFQFEFQGYISDELKNDLNLGKIQSIELITERKEIENIDEHGYVQEKCKKLVLTLRSGEWLKDKIGIIKNLFYKKKDEYDRAKIRFKTPTGVQRTVEIETENFSANGYVKKEKLDGFDFDLSASYDKFCHPILDKMKDLL